MTVGIYAIENLKTGDRYVGQSVNIEKRWSQHRQDLNAGTAYSRALQEAWNDYGGESFAFRILEVCSPTELDERENFHMIEGSSLNHVTSYVVPLSIEHRLGIDPNSVDDDLSDVIDQPPIASEIEFVACLEKLTSLFNEADILAERIEAYLYESDHLDDRLIHHFWEGVREAHLKTVGSCIEIIRRVRGES